MKKKSYFIVGTVVIPFLVVLIAETRGFPDKTFSLYTLILPIIVLLLSLIFAWHKFVMEPSENFLKAIDRAIQGDYRARFSCDRENEIFYRLSQSFNQFMIIVEKQTNELVRNRHLQNQLYENEKVYRSALELTCERVFEADLTHNRLLYGQSTYNRIFPFLKTELYDDIIKSIADHAVYADDARKFMDTFCRANLLKQFTAGDAAEIHLEYRQIVSSGEIYWMDATLIHLSNQSDDSLKTIGYVKNIDERKRHELEILKQSQKDGLTCLYNKRVTQSLVDSYLSEDGCKNKHAAVMLDIDNFKGINDTLGHIQGDIALSQVAEGLQSLFRATDIVGRIGGDEFFILIKNYSSVEALSEKLDLLCNMFDKIRLGKEKNYHISGSIGVSLYPQDGKNYTELYRKADAALYCAKAQGKDCYHICNDSEALKKPNLTKESNQIKIKK